MGQSRFFLQWWERLVVIYFVSKRDEEGDGQWFSNLMEVSKINVPRNMELIDWRKIQVQTGVDFCPQLRQFYSV